MHGNAMPRLGLAGAVHPHAALANKLGGVSAGLEEPRLP